MKGKKWAPGIGRVAFAGDDPSAFSLISPEIHGRAADADTLLFAGRDARDQACLESCLSPALSFLVLGGDWPRALPPKLLLKTGAMGIRVLGPGSEGVIVPQEGERNPGKIALLAEGGALLSDCVRSFRRRGASFGYALSFGRASDYSPLEAASAILSRDDEVALFVFILNSLAKGRPLLDFAAAARGAGRRVGLLPMDAPEVRSRQEQAVLRQYDVLLYSGIDSITDSAMLFTSLAGEDLSDRRLLLNHSPRDERTRLLKNEAERSGFIPVKRGEESPLSLCLLDDSDSTVSIRRRTRMAERKGQKVIFTSSGESSVAQELALKANASFIPGLNRCIRALSTLFDPSIPILKNVTDEHRSGQGARVRRGFPGDAKDMLRAYGIPVAKERLCHSLSEALSAAEAISYPVVLKVVSPSILHKSEARVIALDIQNEEELRNAYGRTLEKARIAGSSKSVMGVLVQEMVRGGIEWRMEYRRDVRFGPVIEASIGGLYGEILPEGVLRAAPFSKEEAMLMISESRGYPLLLPGWQRERLDVEAFSEVLSAFSNLACNETRISRLDVDPIFVNRSGVLVVDAYIERRAGKR